MDKDINLKDYFVEVFSAGNYCPDFARKNLEGKYKKYLEISDKYNRKSVGYQLSSKETFNDWIKYKEGFSQDLVNNLLDELDIKKEGTVLDPFIGSGTTALVCKTRGINCIGYDILPTSTISIKAKENIFDYNITELIKIYELIEKIVVPANYRKRVNFVNISKHAYPNKNDYFIKYVSDYIEKSSFSTETKLLFKLSILNALEECSYTKKNGQCLLWDYRSKKVQLTNQQRLKKGLAPIKKRIIRKDIPDARQVILQELKNLIDDIKDIREDNGNRLCRFTNAQIDYKESSVLFELPKIEIESVDGVITSPPYCNRYDYTRTYALELAYLGVTDERLKELREKLLSCTVENHSKLEKLKSYYLENKIIDRYDNIINTLNKVDAYKEIMSALYMREKNNDLNNKGVITMVEGYFTELSFVIAEMYRILKSGARVAIVNDNVRYGGEVIPVDFLSTEIAEKFGFKCEKIYTLKQQKGNSSQQMAKYGRVPLRKSITIWVKN